MPRRVSGSEKRQKRIWLIGQNPTKDVTALRNLAIALRYNPNDTKAARMADRSADGTNLVSARGARSTVSARRIIGRDIRSGRKNNEIFGAAGDGQLLLWKGDELSLVQSWSLFEKPEASDQQVVQPGFASFSPDGQWLCHYPSDASFG